MSAATQAAMAAEYLEEARRANAEATTLLDKSAALVPEADAVSLEITALIRKHEALVAEMVRLRKSAEQKIALGSSLLDRVKSMDAANGGAS